MIDFTPPSAFRMLARPLYASVRPYAISCFVGALLTDIAYWRTANMLWANFSAWLLTAGLVVSGIAVVAGIFDLVFRRRSRLRVPAWVLVGDLVTVILSLINAFIHSRDAWTSIVPNGLTLSVVVVVVLIGAGVLGWSTGDRARFGVAS